MMSRDEIQQAHDIACLMIQTPWIWEEVQRVQPELASVLPAIKSTLCYVLEHGGSGEAVKELIEQLRNVVCDQIAPAVIRMPDHIN